MLSGEENQFVGSVHHFALCSRSQTLIYEMGFLWQPLMPIACGVMIAFVSFQGVSVTRSQIKIYPCNFME